MPTVHCRVNTKDYKCEQKNLEKFNKEWNKKLVTNTNYWTSPETKSFCIILSSIKHLPQSVFHLPFFSPLLIVYDKLCSFPTVHGMFGAWEEFDQGPEGVFFIHIHKEQSCDLAHPLAVSNFLRSKGEQRHGDFRPITCICTYPNWPIKSSQNCLNTLCNEQFYMRKQYNLYTTEPLTIKEENVFKNKRRGVDGIETYMDVLLSPAPYCYVLCKEP